MMLKGCILDFTGIPVVGRFTVKSWQHEINYILGSSTKQVLRITVQFEPVEVWLLFNLAYPFLVILVNIVVNVSNDLNKVVCAKRKRLYIIETELQVRDE